MHDIRNLDERGLAGGFVASREFEPAALAQGQALGFQPAVVYVDHPIQDRTDEEMRALARDSAEAVLAMIRT